MANTRRAAATQTATITIDAEPVETISVNLVGVLYHLAPPKTALSMQLAKFATGLDAANMTPDSAVEMFDAVEGWVRGSFRADAEAVLARLSDPEDDLDYEHIMALMPLLQEAASGNPPMSSNGSSGSRSRAGRRSTAGPSVAASQS